ncbi:hypothetical protein [Streptomyces sp. NBC_00328]|uniref:hypothetical protein n=1 Tax=Streptomyces sp. NBC_00328 TaxID=2903646 RepID=UPI002E2BAD18|nr:hypothetical protein [Streptomyces sp. NBC_00328]
MLEVLQGNRPGALIFGISVLAGALLFIWRDGNLRRRGIFVSAKCVQQARDGKGLVTLRLAYEVDGLQYYCDSLPYQFPPAGIGQCMDVIYDSKDPSYSEVVSQRGRGIVPWIVGGIAAALLLVTGISYL